MKKIPCLFQRTFKPRLNGKGTVAELLPAVTLGLEWVLDGGGVATVKIDGTACAVIERDGFMPWVPLPLRSRFHLFKRYDAKGGKPAPANGIPCDDPDPVTGHWPHWIPVEDEPESRWHREAYLRLPEPIPVGTYELAGPHLQGNPHGYPEDVLIRHGSIVVDLPSRTFEGLREYLSTAAFEGIVFWADSEPQCKIRRADYGFAWGAKRR